MRVSPDTYNPTDPDDGSNVLRGQSCIEARAWQHGRLWVNDADCLVARPSSLDAPSGRRSSSAGAASDQHRTESCTSTTGAWTRSVGFSPHRLRRHHLRPCRRSAPHDQRRRSDGFTWKPHETGTLPSVAWTEATSSSSARLAARVS